MKYANFSDFQDRLLADMLLEQKKWISHHFEHDSLLKNVVEEELTDAERELAWEDYERERRGIRISNLDSLDVYKKAMPILTLLMREGDEIIAASGQSDQFNMETIVRSWIQNVTKNFDVLKCI